MMRKYFSNFRSDRVGFPMSCHQSVTYVLSPCREGEQRVRHPKATHVRNPCHPWSIHSSDFSRHLTPFHGKSDPIRPKIRKIFAHHSRTKSSPTSAVPCSKSAFLRSGGEEIGDGKVQ